MRRLYHALHLYFGSCLTWRSAWRIARAVSPYRVVARDGFLFIEPRRFS